VPTTGKRVEQRDVRLALRLVADRDLDDLDAVRIRRKHRGKTVNDDLVVVHQGDRDGLPGGGHTVGLPVRGPYQTPRRLGFPPTPNLRPLPSERVTGIRSHTNGDRAEGL